MVCLSKVQTIPNFRFVFEVLPNAIESCSIAYFVPTDINYYRKEVSDQPELPDRQCIRALKAYKSSGRF